MQGEQIVRQDHGCKTGPSLMSAPDWTPNIDFGHTDLAAIAEQFVFGSFISHRGLLSHVFASTASADAPRYY